MTNEISVTFYKYLEGYVTYIKNSILSIPCGKYITTECEKRLELLAYYDKVSGPRLKTIIEKVRDLNNRNNTEAILNALITFNLCQMNFYGKNNIKDFSKNKI